MLHICCHPCALYKYNQKGGERMSKQKNKDLKNNKAMPKSDVEFAQNGLEKVAIKAQERKNK
jgi:hypothetical protein